MFHCFQDSPQSLCSVSLIGLHRRNPEDLFHNTVTSVGSRLMVDICTVTRQITQSRAPFPLCGVVRQRVWPIFPTRLFSAISGVGRSGLNGGRPTDATSQLIKSVVRAQIVGNRSRRPRQQHSRGRRTYHPDFPMPGFSWCDSNVRQSLP